MKKECFTREIFLIIKSVYALPPVGAPPGEIPPLRIVQNPAAFPRRRSMMTRINHFLTTLCSILLISSLAGCSPGKPQGSEHDAGEVSLCNLTEDLIGWRVTTKGEVTFIDLSPPDGVYFELEDGGCAAGGFAHNEFWNTFSEEQQQQIALENLIQIEGILVKNEGRMIVSVQKLQGAQ
jgi:hypothetical protein